MRKIIFLSSLALFLSNPSKAQDFTIISWNIKFLPRVLLHIKHRPLKRVQPIAEHLLKDTADVLVLQEAFDNLANRRLIKKLNGLYPFYIGPANKKCCFKLSSGILILSRHPIRQLATIDFKSCEKEDCFARKGALLVEVRWNDRQLQVLGTHLEAGGGKEIKMEQYQEIASIVKPNAKEGIPQFLCGDFNTRKTDTFLYPRMLAILDAEDGSLHGELQFTSDHLLNDMSNYRPDDREVIDFILYRGNGIPLQKATRSVTRYQSKWSKQNRDLSDHFGVKIRCVF